MRDSGLEEGMAVEAPTRKPLTLDSPNRPELAPEEQNAPQESQPVLGAYEVLKVTPKFPRNFWIVMELDEQLVMEVEDLDGFSVGYIKRVDLERAVDKGDVRLDGGL